PLSGPAPTSPDFPYTTLFRSGVAADGADEGDGRPGVDAAVKDDDRQLLRGPLHRRREGRGGHGRHDEQVAVPAGHQVRDVGDLLDRKSTRLNSSHVKISYAVC